MSADNNIVIVKFPDGWRVCHAQACENITCYPEGSKERKEILRDYFGDSKLFNTEEEAYKKASELEKEYEYIEYGIANYGELESFEEATKMEETEFFECACHDKNHLIIARKDFWTGKDSKNKEYKEIDISLEFTAVKGDWESYYYKDFILFRFFKKFWWRLKESFKILIKGSYKVEDIWESAWTEEYSHRGVAETKRLGETLIRFAEDFEKFWSMKNE